MSEARLSLSFSVASSPYESARVFSFSPSPFSFYQHFLRLWVLRIHRVSLLSLLPSSSSLLELVLSMYVYIYLSRSHIQLAFTSVFPSHSRGSRRSDLSAVLTTDRDRQACNYIVIYACYGAQPAWPVGLQRTPPFPAPRQASCPLALSRMWI